MPEHRHQPRELSGSFFVKNVGLETSLIYEARRGLPCFASYTSLKDESGCQLMLDYLEKYAQVAQKYEVGWILESATWCVHPDCLKKPGLC